MPVHSRTHQHRPGIFLRGILRFSEFASAHPSMTSAASYGRTLSGIVRPRQAETDARMALIEFPFLTEGPANQLDQP